MTVVRTRLLVVVSGLAASGKTTVGQALSERLHLPLVDKDEILEALFDTIGCDDREQRYRLSRASDEVLYKLAKSAGTAVLVNWWDHESSLKRLRAISPSFVEVFCECPVELAAARFVARERHPGHLDRLRTSEEHEEGLHLMRESFRGPLRLSEHLVTVDTSRAVDVEGLVARVRSAIAAAIDSIH